MSNDFPLSDENYALAQLFGSLDAGAAEARECLEACLEVAANTAAPFRTACLNPAAPPPFSLIASVAYNRLGEMQIDCGDDKEAQASFTAALREWPENVEALLSLSHIHRDHGELEATQARLEAVVRLPPLDPIPCGSVEDWDWPNEWIIDPRTTCLSLAAYHLAHLLSRLGKHAAALPVLQSLGVRWRIAPHVWERAYSQTARSSRDVAKSEQCSSIPALIEGAVPSEIGAVLLSAFAPDAAYWAENGYDAREYFSWWFDPCAPPTNAVERLILHLLPLVEARVPRDQLIGGAEWWVHSRTLGADFGHQV